MSVVDNWEELENSEKMSLPGVMPSSAVRKADTSKESNNSQQINGESKDGLNNIQARAAIILEGDDSNRSQYVSSEPRVKILKRPENSKPDGKFSLTEKKPLNIKSLKQREQEYAEARLRILGQKKCSESDDDVSPSPPNVQIIRSLQTRTEGLKLETNDQGKNIIRQPKGPDGSKGFKSNR